MRQQVILVSKILFGDESKINYSTIAKIFKSNINSIKHHINSSDDSNKNIFNISRRYKRIYYSDCL